VNGEVSEQAMSSVVILCFYSTVVSRHAAVLIAAQIAQASGRLALTLVASSEIAEQ
jgi:hypothetical protein